MSKDEVAGVDQPTHDEKAVIREGDSSDNADNVVEPTQRRKSAGAMNIVENPLKVSTLTQT